MLNKNVFIPSDGLTFDDVLIVPGYSEVLPTDVSISVQLCENLALNIPILSAAMDTVSEGCLAIALAREGGIGILHRNMSPDEQAKQVDQVKRSEAGMITDPITLPPTATLEEAKKLNSAFPYQRRTHCGRRQQSSGWNPYQSRYAFCGRPG